MRPLHVLSLCLVCSCQLDSQPAFQKERQMEVPGWMPAEGSKVGGRNGVSASVAPSSLTGSDAGKPNKNDPAPRSTDATTRMQTAADAGVPIPPPASAGGSPATATLPGLSAGSSAARGGSAGATAVGRAPSAAAGCGGSAVAGPTPVEVLPTGTGTPPSIDMQPGWPASRTPSEPESNPADPKPEGKPADPKPESKPADPKPEGKPAEPGNEDKQPRTSTPGEPSGNGRGNENRNGNGDSDHGPDKKNEQDPRGEPETKREGSDKQDKSPDESDQQKDKKDEPKKDEPKKPK